MFLPSQLQSKGQPTAYRRHKLYIYMISNRERFNSVDSVGRVEKSKIDSMNVPLVS